MQTTTRGAAAALPGNGYVLFFKRECPTCALVASLIPQIEKAAPLVVFTQDDPSFPEAASWVVDDTALEQARAGRLHKASIRTQLAESGIRVTPELVDGLLDEARDHAQRIDLEREQLALLQATGLPIVQLPALPGGVDAGSIRELAGLLAPLFAPSHLAAAVQA